MLHIVYTQHLENYGDTAKPFWKFKGGSILLCRAERRQDAMALALGWIVSRGSSHWEYPNSAVPFETEEAARASIEEWEQIAAELG